MQKQMVVAGWQCFVSLLNDITVVTRYVIRNPNWDRVSQEMGLVTCDQCGLYGETLVARSRGQQFFKESGTKVCHAFEIKGSEFWVPRMGAVVKNICLRPCDILHSHRSSRIRSHNGGLWLLVEFNQEFNIVILRHSHVCS